ncbi:EF-hand domain-containing protein [Thiolapillus sp.]|uniref:EF-hand domain-containing protein n=5 Tax=Thiolapillus sp. TaxID=2017437 RepID=UPI0025EAF4A3|nr:EF-hand domain-containing protein [Thiolapillus sp.]
MKILNETMVLLAAGSLLVLAVQAAEMPARGSIPFTVYDQDGNGSISQTEFSAARAERMAGKAAAGMPMRGMGSQPSFSIFDADGNGQLSAEELAAGQQKMQQQRRGMGSGQGRGMGRSGNMPAFDDFDLNSAAGSWKKNSSRPRGSVSARVPRRVIPCAILAILPCLVMSTAIAMAASARRNFQRTGCSIGSRECSNRSCRISA